MNKIEKSFSIYIILVLCLIILSLIGLLNLPLAAKTLSLFNTIIPIKDLFSILLTAITVIVGIFSIWIANESLNYNKRANIAYDSYIPIIEEMEFNLKSPMLDNTLMKYEKLNSVSQTYLKYAFDEKTLTKITHLTDIIQKINQRKKYTEENFRNNILKHFPDTIKYENEQYEVSSLLVVKNGSITHEIPITYNFYKNNLKQSLLMDNFILYCKIYPKYWRNFTDDEGNVVAEGYDTDYNRWSEIPVEKVLEGYYDVEEYEGIIFNNRFTKFLDDKSISIKEEFEASPHYINLNKKYIEAQRLMETLKLEFETSLRNMLLPKKFWTLK